MGYNRYNPKRMATGGNAYSTIPRSGIKGFEKPKSMTIPRSGFASGGLAPRIGMATGGNAEDLVSQAYASIGRTGFGDTVNTIDQEGFDWWVNALNTGQVSEADFNASFQGAVDDYVAQNPDDEYSQYVNTFRTTSTETPNTVLQPLPIGSTTVTSNDATSQAIVDWLTQNPNATDAQIAAQMDVAGVTPAQVAAATGVSEAEIQQRYDAASASTGTTSQPNYSQLVTDAYSSIGRSGFGTTADTIDQEGFDWWVNALNTGAVTPENFTASFNAAVAANQAAADEAAAAAAAAANKNGTTGDFPSGINPSYSDVSGEETPIASLMEAQAGITGTPTALPTGTEYTPALQQVQSDELLDPNSVVLGDVTATAAQAGTDNLEVSTPTKTAAATYEAYTQPGTPEAIAAQGKLSAESIVGDIQGVVSQQSIAEAAQGEVSEEATVKYQLEQLFKSFEEGSPPPAWAAPAVRQVGAIMSKRGLGTSSMAAAAVMQAVMESGIPIAQADAQTFAQMDIANLNARQQTALANAATYAAMDRANLDARMQAAITNAQSFLSMDTANLTNAQRANELTHQAEVQKMTNDQAAINAAAQFNAKTQNEVDQFFAELEVQVENANMNRIAAQEQFNVNQVNAMEQFNTSMLDARQRFEVQMKQQIEASNAEWRRSINTANTATQNAANQINAQNLLNLTATAQANLWQRYRDESAWIFQMSESALNRQHQIATMNLTFAEDQARYDQALEDQTAEKLGEMAYNVIFG